jgi:hypothetical protein
MTQPLRSARVTGPHHYYGLLRPGAPHRYSGSRGANHLNASLHIGTTGSHVPRRSPEQLHATSTADTTWPVNRLPPDSSRTTTQDPVSMSPVFAFDASAVVRLRSSRYPTHDVSRDAFSLTLTTPALDRSSSGLFEPPPAGRLRRAYLHLLQSYGTDETSCLGWCLVAHALLQNPHRGRPCPAKSGHWARTTANVAQAVSGS